MSKRNSTRAVPDHLESTYALIQRAFPGGIPPDAYLPLLRILAEEMSIRSVARVIADLQGADYAVVFNDVLRAQSTHPPDAAVKERLLACGYEEWLVEPA